MNSISRICKIQDLDRLTFSGKKEYWSNRFISILCQTETLKTGINIYVYICINIQKVTLCLNCLFISLTYSYANTIIPIISFFADFKISETWSRHVLQVLSRKGFMFWGSCPLLSLKTVSVYVLVKTFSMCQMSRYFLDNEHIFNVLISFILNYNIWEVISHSTGLFS